MKKILISTSLILSLFSFTTLEAFAQQTEATIGKSMTTISTSRISLSSSEVLHYYFANGSNNRASIYIFKNGNLYYSTTGIGWTHFSRTLNAPAGEYSIRIYCGTRSNPTTGCVGTAKIGDRPLTY